jgi:hypothetical protein
MPLACRYFFDKIMNVEWPENVSLLYSFSNTEVSMSDKKKEGPREEFRLDGSKVVEKIKELIHAGNIRRIILKNEEGKTLIEIPLTLGVVGAALLPVIAAVGAIAALAASMTIVVEKIE